MKEVDWYWNFEKDDNIICPYCGEEYIPTYDETIIGDKCVNCYSEDEEEYICDNCYKKFQMRGLLIWKYETETIDGQLTQEDYDSERWMDEIN